MAFNLEDYEDVATLNKWFILNYPMGRSDISVISHDTDKGFILIKASLWRDDKDVQPATSNIAFGSRDSYIQNMRKFYVEDTATSALGRAIILLKGSDKTATKNDMRKVDDFKPKYGAPGSKSAAMEMALHLVDRQATETANEASPVVWSVGESVVQIAEVAHVSFTCKHGDMVKKEGVSKSTGRPFAGYVCSAPKADACDAKWATLTGAGTWYWPDDSESGKGGE
jgi:hypothetical protein